MAPRIIDSAGAVLDRAIGLFSPRTELNRLAAREMVGKIRATYAGAKHNDLTGGWNPTDPKVNIAIGDSAAQLRARSRQLVRDMPAMATALDRLEEFTVGRGITLQGRVKDPSTGKLLQGINQRIEDAWHFWCDQADDGGRLHFHEIQQLAARQEIETGEYIIIKKHSPAAKRYLPFSLLMLEADQLTGYGAKPLPGNAIHQGVEYDPRTGRAIAYHFEDADRWKQPLRVTADQVILGFKTLRPGQLRGVTPLAPAMIMAHQLRDYLEAEIATAQKAARWLAFVTSQDPQASMQHFGALATPGAAIGASHDKYTMDMGHAIVDFLKTGEEVKIADHNRPGDAFAPFVRYMLQTFAATLGVSYELISGDYTDAKYSSVRVSRNDMLKAIKVRRGRLLRQLCDPVRREFMDWAVVTGKLDLPGYFANPAPWLRAVWMEPGMEQIDPLREGRAENDAVEAKLRSPHEVLQARGRDPEQVLDEWAEWQQMLADRGLQGPVEQSPLKSNPAAVADQGGKPAPGLAKQLRRIK